MQNAKRVTQADNGRSSVVFFFSPSPCASPSCTERKKIRADRPCEVNTDVVSSGFTPSAVSNQGRIPAGGAGEGGDFAREPNDDKSPASFLGGTLAPR